MKSNEFFIVQHGIILWFHSIWMFFSNIWFCFQRFQKFTEKFWCRSDWFKIFKFRTWLWRKLKKSISQLPTWQAHYSVWRQSLINSHSHFAVPRVCGLKPLRRTNRLKAFALTPPTSVMSFSKTFFSWKINWILWMYLSPKTFSEIYVQQWRSLVLEHLI